MTTAEHTAKCRRCHRPLRSATSVALGLGPRCAAIEAAFAGLNGKQRAKADQLITDKAIVKVRKGIYRAAAEEGQAVHIASVNGNCTCAFGLRRVSATTKTCYVVAVARLMDKPRRVVRRSDFGKAA